VNITPLTNLMIANLVGTTDPSAWFAGLNTSTATLTNIETVDVDTTLNKLRTVLIGLTPLITINPVTTEFAPIAGNVCDDMLTALKTAMNSSGISDTTMLNAAADPDFNAPLPELNAALTAAYKETTSGSPMPQVTFSASPTPAGTTYTAQLCYGGVNQCNPLGNSLFISSAEIIEAGEDLPAALAYAYEVVEEFNFMLMRMWKAHTYPTGSLMEEIFANAIAEDLANDSANAVANAGAAFTAAGFPAAKNGGEGGVVSGSADALDYPQSDYSFTCDAQGGGATVQVSDGPCLDEQRAYAKATSCNIIDANYTFNSVGKPFYQCAVSNSTGDYQATYQQYLTYFSN
jgi:hypothetical protein